MRITFLKIKAFGKFKDLDIAFSSGLNFIYGLNEAGKSTLQKCFLGLLYGFKDPNKKIRSYEDDFSIFQPWDDVRYDARMQYQLDDKSKIEVWRDFKSEKIEIRNAKTGEDITSNFPEDRTKEKLFAEKHLGLSKNAFLSTVFVKQAQIKDLEAPSALMHKIQSLAGTGTEDISSVQGIEKLKTALTECKSEVKKTKKEIDNLEEKKEKLFTLQQEQLQDLDELQQLKKKCEELKIQKKKLEFLKLKSEEVNLDAKIKDLKVLEEKIAEIKEKLRKFEKYRRFSLEVYNQINRINAKLEEAVNFLSNLKNTKESLNKEIIQIQNKLNKDFPNWENSLEDPETAVVQYEIFIKIKEADLKKVQEESDGLNRAEDEVKKQLNYYKDFFSKVADLRDLENQIAGLEKDVSRLTELVDIKEQDKQNVGKGLIDSQRNFNLASKLNIISIVLFAAILAAVFIFNKFNALITSLVFLFLIFLGSGYLRFNIRNKIQVFEKELIKINHEIKQAEEDKKNTQEKISKFLLTAQAKDFIQLRARYNEFLKVRDNLTYLDTQKQAFLGELTGLKNLINQKAEAFKLFMTSCSFFAKEINPSIIMDFKKSIKEYRELKKIGQNLTGEIQKIFLEIAAIEDKKNTYQDKLNIILEEQGIKLEQIEEYLKFYGEYDKLSNSLNNLENERKMKLNNKNINYWPEEKNKITKQLESPDFDFELKQAEISPDLAENYSEELEAKKTAESDLKVAIGKLESKLSSKYPDINLADAEEELESAKIRFNQLLDFECSLEKASETLSQMSQRYHEDILAPELNKKLSQLIFKITDKYKEIKVGYKQEKADLGFNINVTIPSLDIIKEAENLSFGTQEQFYLALKISMAQILSQKAERLPFFLDDVFSNFDVLRREKAFEFILSLSKEHQIFFFTSDINQYYQIKDILKKKSISSKEKQIEDMLLLC